jgi:tRNA-2-methylthio-N6-dimethylallyladenosine synthase
MNRGYSSGDYLKLVEQAQEKIENLSLTTDLIVGFPSEIEEDFQQTLNMVEKVEFDSAFMFRYSVREGTKAASFPDDVPEKVKLERLHTLIELQKQVSKRKNQRMVGKILKVLVDEESKRDKNKWKGKTRTNKTVVIQKDKDILGIIASVKIHEADSFTLFGKLS